MFSTITLGIYSSLANNGFGNKLKPGMSLHLLSSNTDQSFKAIIPVAVSVDLDLITMQDALQCVISACAAPLEKQFIDVDGRRYSLQETDRIYKAAQEIDARSRNKLQIAFRKTRRKRKR